MQVFPPNNPALRIVSVAGQAVAQNPASPVYILLPFGSNMTVPVVVEANNFSQNVPIRVALTPEQGDRVNHDASIDNTTVNPAQTTVNVDFTAGISTRVDVWTR